MRHRWDGRYVTDGTGKSTRQYRCRRCSMVVAENPQRRGCRGAIYDEKGNLSKGRRYE